MIGEVKRAAKIAAPVYEAEGWTWASLGGGVPDEFDIAEQITELVRDVSEAGALSASTGRIMVRRDPEDGTFDLYLSLGYVAGEGVVF